jgi:hypothetical protein
MAGQEFWQGHGPSFGNGTASAVPLALARRVLAPEALHPAYPPRTGDLALLPTATKKITLLPSACGEKNSITSSS